MEDKSLFEKLLQIKDKFHIFQNMSEEEITLIVRNIVFRSHKPGEFIMRENEIKEEIYYIVSGRCNVITNKKIVAYLEKGSLIGEVASLKQEPRNASIRAIEESVLLSFEIAFTEEERVPLAFAKYYKNIAIDLANKLEKNNKK